MDVNTLNTILKSILPTVDPIEKVSTAILGTGILEENDLQWVVEEDISSVLPPAQRRKLIGTLKSTYGTGIHFIFQSNDV